MPARKHPINPIRISSHSIPSLAYLLYIDPSTPGLAATALFRHVHQLPPPPTHWPTNSTRPSKRSLAKHLLTGQRPLQRGVVTLRHRPGLWPVAVIDLQRSGRSSATPGDQQCAVRIHVAHHHAAVGTTSPKTKTEPVSISTPQGLGHVVQAILCACKSVSATPKASQPSDSGAAPDHKEVLGRPIPKAS